MTFAQLFVTESAAIEGQTIPEKFIDESAHMFAYLSMLAIADADAPLTQADLKNWQRLIGEEQHLWGDLPIADYDLGTYRQHGVYVGGREGTRWTDIEAEMDDLWPQVVERSDNPLDQAAAAHYRYERIHPFADGNGRTGRLLALYTLRRAHIPPVLFTNADKRDTYYPCFEARGPGPMMGYFQQHQRAHWR